MQLDQRLEGIEQKTSDAHRDVAVLMREIFAGDPSDATVGAESAGTLARDLAEIGLRLAGVALRVNSILAGFRASDPPA